MLVKILLMLAFAALAMARTGRSSNEEYQTATFAGGCFWCMEYPFESQEGVIAVVSGYTGGKKEDPTYEEVCSGSTGHLEAVQITFDPEKISYPELLEIFWKQIDPTDTGGQFADRGSQYETAIYYHSSEQKKLAEKSRAELDKSGRYDKPVITPIEAAVKFHNAEEYHQDFYKKSPLHYKRYRMGSGRDKFLGNIWDKK